MPGKSRTAVLSVAEILNKCQDTAGAHGKYARMLWDVEKADSDSCFKDLIRCLSHMLTTPLNTNANVERAFRFIVTFTAQTPARGDGSCSVFVQDLVADLVLLSTAANKTVRIRSCSLLAGIMQRLSTDLSDETLDELQEAMLGRLKDKVPQVRLHAASVLERMAEPGEDGSFANDPIIRSYRKLLSVERNKDVRKCILGVMPIVAQTTLEEVIERTRDVSDAVRKQAFLVLANKCSLADLPAAKRALLLRRGLQDRVGGVVDAAKTLVQVWLIDACASNVLALLAELDVRRHPEEAEQALNALEATKNLQLSTIAHDAQQNSTGLRSTDNSTLLRAEEAFFWRWACERLFQEGEKRGREAAALRGAEAEVKAAEASDHLQALEAALPESVAAMLEKVSSHATQGSEHGYAVNQLLKIAAHCMDLSDASGRKAASELLDSLLRHSDWTSTEGWESPLLKLARQVHNAPSQLQAWLAESAFGFQQRFASPGASPQEWIQGLTVSRLFLQQLSSLRPVAGKDPAVLLHELIFPALSQTKEIRAAGVRSLGLFSMLSTSCFRLGSAPSMEQTLPVSLLRAALSEPAQLVRIEAAKALCDLLLVRGPKVLDACHTFLVAHPSEYRSNTGNISAAAEAAAADSQPLLQVLLQSLGNLPAIKDARAADKIAEAAALSSIVAEGLSKLVMHQSRWNESSQGRMEDSEIVQVLVRLLTISVDPATEHATAARQCLSVFFTAYAAFSASHHRLLCEAVIPAARRALALPAKSAAPNLLRFTLHLLQTKTPEDTEGVGDDGHAQLAERCLSEALACPNSVPARPYIGAIVKLAANISLKSAGQEKIKALKVLAEHAKANLGTGMAAKDVASLVKRLSALDASPAEPLSAEAVEEILQRANRGAECAESEELPFCAPVAPTPARSTRRRAAQRAAIVDETTSEEASEESESEADDESSGSEHDNGGVRAEENRKIATPTRRRGPLQENMMSPTI